VLRGVPPLFPTLTEGIFLPGASVVLLVVEHKANEHLMAFIVNDGDNPILKPLRLSGVLDPARTPGAS
jgi:hypothetical protein